MKEQMLKVDHVSKRYRLGVYGGTTLREELQRRRAKRLGLEDPTRQIGAELSDDGETFLALDDVSFEAARGERVGIIGRNGAGKSTLLKLISRITSPTSGEIGLNGRIASMLEVGTGFHGELTGRENIYMNGAILGMKQREIDRKIEDIIEFSEVRRFIDTPVKRYSSGMFVKLAFSVAAHLDAEIVIMDEVLAVGDIAFQKKCIDKMNEIARSENRTILYVSHNMGTIRALCDRCLLLEKGRLVYDGEVETAIVRYAGKQGISGASIDLRDANRSAYRIDGKLRISTLVFPEDPFAVFPFGQSITMRIVFSVSEDLSNLFFRIPVFTADGARVGTLHTPVLSRVEAGEHSLLLRLSLEGLLPNRYSLWLIARSDGLLESAYDHDVVSNAARFEIVHSDLKSAVIPGGNYGAWGPIRFPEAEIIERC